MKVSEQHTYTYVPVNRDGVQAMQRTRTVLDQLGYITSTGISVDGLTLTAIREIDDGKDAETERR